MMLEGSFHYAKKCYNGSMLEIARIIFLYLVPSLICLTLIGFIAQIVYQRMQNREKLPEELAKQERQHQRPR
jgi:hypothetical protein|tara:strand:+ start:318 stop:533 length:216 start_codon:yes stop_codon:yes gene_type:complete